MQKLPAVQEAQAAGLQFHDIVLRRKDALTQLKNQLLDPRGKPKFKQAGDTRTIYASPLVDVAATVELAKETLEACLLILEHTHWNIRLLSKSNLLPYIAERIPEAHRLRVIYGVSTGTLDDRIAHAFESGTPLVSKRLQSLYKLQDMGLRTFGMICPSLPQTDYDSFSKDIVAAVRPDKCEHVWAEVINVRGDSMTRTCAALVEAGYGTLAQAVEAVSSSPEAWEEYSRQTFLAHTKHVPADKLRFLQYVNEGNIDWWKPYKDKGAVLLGQIASSL
jgi:DNA repair photolyase